MQQSDTINELVGALAKAQADMENPHKDKTANAGSRTYHYTDIASGLAAIRPVLSAHGLAVTQSTSVEGGAVLLHTQLSHVSGQWMRGTYPVCSTEGKHQDMGSAMTYARRYALFAMVGIAPEDDDGASAAKSAGPRRESTSARATVDSPAPYAADESDMRASAMIEQIERMDSVGAISAFAKTEGATYKRLLPDDQQRVKSAMAGQKQLLSEAEMVAA